MATILPLTLALIASSALAAGWAPAPRGLAHRRVSVSMVASPAQPFDVNTLLQMLKDKERLLESNERLLNVVVESKERLLKEKDVVVESKERLLKEKDKRLEEKEEVVRSKEETIDALRSDKWSVTNELTRYRCILDNRALLEWGLTLKYPGMSGTFTSKWERFCKEKIVVNGTLQAAPRELIKQLKCDEKAAVIADNLQTLYNRQSALTHSYDEPRAGPGWACGGGLAEIGCASAIAIKMLLDDVDVQRHGVYPKSIQYIAGNRVPFCTFFPNQIIFQQAKIENATASITESPSQTSPVSASA